MSDLSRVEAIFLGALEKGDPDECAAYLDHACRGEGETRRQVERLLQAHPKAGRYLELPDANADATRSIDLGPTSELAGTAAVTSCSNRSGKGGWGPSGWPSRPSRSGGWSPSS
jgi:hypothetical protein